MRISTTQFQQQSIDAMQNATSVLQHTQGQLATGKQMLTPSDNPDAASNVLELQQAITTSGQYQSNGDIATNRLNLEDSTLSNVNNVLMNIRDLALQANVPGQTTSDHQAIAAQMRQDLEQLVSLGNTKDANGEYLFAGSKTQTQPFTVNANKVTYHGDQASRSVQVGTANQVAIGDSGWNVFMNIPTGDTNGVFMTGPKADNNGSGTIDAGTVVDQKAWVPDTYHISFSSPSSYQVLNSGGSLVASGTYTSGSAIAFDGVQTKISGTPAAGDSFTIAGIGANPANTGSGVLDHSIVVDSTAMKPDIYTLSFPSQGDYQIVDSTGAVVKIGTYQSGDPINFNGIQTKITGAPNAGDRFVIEPPAQQDIFSTVNTMATTLEDSRGIQTSSSIASAVSNALQNIDSAQTRVSDIRATVGARLNRVSSAQDSENYFSVQLSAAKSKLSDLDYTTAISTLNLQTVGLQAAQQAYVKVSNLSLFNYLR